MNVISLSDYVISLFDLRNVPITNLKLQKVLYYIQGYFYKNFGKCAFEEEIYNWHYGPVVPTAYFRFNSYRASKLAPLSQNTDMVLPESENRLIQRIVEKCTDISTSKLVSMTHSESPWKQSRPDELIEKQSISTFFRMNDPLELTA